MLNLHFSLKKLAPSLIAFYARSFDKHSVENKLIQVWFLLIKVLLGILKD